MYYLSVENTLFNIKQLKTFLRIFKNLIYLLFLKIFTFYQKT